MPVFVVYPWLVAPVAAGGELMKLLRHLPAAGALGVLLAGVKRSYAIPLAVAVPSTFFVLCVLIAKWVARSRAQACAPFDAQEPAPSLQESVLE